MECTGSPDCKNLPLGSGAGMPRKWVCTVALGALLCSSVAAVKSLAQKVRQVPQVQQGPGFPGVPSSDRGYGGRPEPEAYPGVEHSREVAREKDRQRRMVEDSSRLVKLTEQYRESVQKHGASTPEDARLLLDVERLARSVKDRMRGM